MSFILDAAVKDISIHSPHARGDIVRTSMRQYQNTISIHSPHARGDAEKGVEGVGSSIFQSTPLMRGETA